jgi:hypothetical protein
MQYSSYATTIQQQHQPSDVQDPSLNLAASNWGPTAPSNVPSQSPTSESKDKGLLDTYTGTGSDGWRETKGNQAGDIRPSASAISHVGIASRAENGPGVTIHQQTNVVAAPSTPLLVKDITEKYVGPRDNEDTPAVSKTIHSFADRLSSPVAAPTTPPTFSGHDDGIEATTSPCTPHNANLKMQTRDPRDVSFDNLSRPAPRIEAAPIVGLVATAGASETTADRTGPTARAKELPYINDPKLLSISNLHSSDAQTARAIDKAVETIPEPWAKYMKALEQLPCMDCGENDGHKRDCHLDSKCFDSAKLLHPALTSFGY